VRLIDENGVQVGVVPIQQALATARERSFDLIEVAPSANPPVCRIMDYGKYKYLQQKREKEARKKHKQAELRMVKMRPLIDDHDFEVKLKLVRRLLADGDKVRVNLVFRMREMPHPELGRQLLQRMVAATSDVAQVDRPTMTEGRMMTIILAPK
jgi:translation initiation factor IF-3